MKYGWTIQKYEWLHAFRFLENAEWHKIAFKPEHKPIIPNRTGVYVICQQGSKISGAPGHSFWQSMYSPLYIGRATDLQRRYSDHISCRTDAKKIVMDFANLDFWWAEFEIAEYKQVESIMIKVFGPPGNQQEGDRLYGRFLEGLPANSTKY